MNLFPIIQPETQDVNVQLPLYKETAWNFDADCPVFKNGNPVVLTGAEAVKVWAWNALHTVRKKYEIYTWNYGNDLEGLIGQPYSDEVKTLEAKRYLKECLLVNPYIKDVTDMEVSFAEDKLSLSCKVITIYGEVQIRG